jgi:probable rRNA maturation factor
VKNIEFFFDKIEPFLIPVIKIKRGINNLIKEESGITGEISIIFCSDQYLLEVNRKFLKHDFYTDIITFDYVEKNIISGDLLISKERIEDNSKKFGRSFEEELFRVIFHGILHLCGYKDKNEADKVIMRNKENYYLGKSGYKNF